MSYFLPRIRRDNEFSASCMLEKQKKFFEILNEIVSLTEEKVSVLSFELVAKFFPSVQVKIGE